jgi:hypothetical protein
MNQKYPKVSEKKLTLFGLKQYLFEIVKHTYKLLKYISSRLYCRTNIVESQEHVFKVSFKSRHLL